MNQSKRKINAKHKAFQEATKRIQALINFGSIKTTEAALKELGLNPDVYGKEYTNVKKFREFVEYVEPLLLKGWEAMEVKEEIVAQEQHYPFPWNEKDFLIESIGCDFKSSWRKRQDYLRSIVPNRSEKQQGSCLYFQENNALEVFNAITQEHKPAVYIRANTGDGKTFAAGQLIRWFIDSGFLEDKSISPWKILYVTGASIIDQTEEVLQEHFGLDTVDEVHVVNYESLRASFGKSRFIAKKIVVEDGIEYEIWEWRQLIHPALIFWDEAHKLKNENSTQSRISQAANNLSYTYPYTQKPAEIFQIFMSASPFSRVCQAKSFAVATRKEFKTTYGAARQITNGNWKNISKLIASPSDPTDFSRAAIKRLIKEFKDYIFPFKNVRRKFKAILKTELINFRTPQDAEAYKIAWEKFLEFKRQIEGMEYGNSQFLILVQLLVFRMAAEILRSYELAQRIYNDIQNGFSPVVACAFKPTIAKVVLHLVNDFNVPRSKISIIWGGNIAYSGAEARKALTLDEIKAELIKAVRDPFNIDHKKIKQIHSQLKAESEGLGEIPKELKLGLQTKEQRNIERKRFQNDTSVCCLFTFGAGKEGLSLHQFTETMRPRRQYNTPTYNEMEMLQAEGRTARINSCSDTEITTLVYRDTIEVPVLRRVLAKRQCLDVVMSHGSIEPSLTKELDAIAALLDSREETGREEDEDLEEQAFNEMEQEITQEDEDEEEE